MKEYLPCPFCGSDVGFGSVVVCEEKSHSYLYAIRCNRCDSRSSLKDTKEEAIEAWNHRV